MTECAVHTGILFSRKACGKPASIYCGRCEIPLCKEHLVPQQSGPFLCPQCDRYVNDNDHDWERSDRGWRWRGGRSRSQEPNPTPAAVPAPLDQEDEAGFAAGDETAESNAGATADAQADAAESDFDAS